MMEDFQTAIVPVELSDGAIVNIEATVRGEQQVSSQTQLFAPVKDTIKAVAREMLGILEEAQPDKVRSGENITLFSTDRGRNRVANVYPAPNRGDRSRNGFFCCAETFAHLRPCGEKGG
jgi:hypothetical protein